MHGRQAYGQLLGEVAGADDELAAVQVQALFEPQELVDVTAELAGFAFDVDRCLTVHQRHHVDFVQVFVRKHHLHPARTKTGVFWF